MSNIVSIILILASAGLFFGYIDPTYVKVKDLLTEQANYDRALDNAKQYKLEQQKHLKKLNEMSTIAQAKLAKLLPDNIDNIRLIIDIDETAKKYNMRIRNFKADVSAQKDTIGRDDVPYGTLTLSFSTTASYPIFIAFMKELEKSLRIMDITAVTFNSSDTSQLYDYGVTLKTYWLK